MRGYYTHYLLLFTPRTKTAEDKYYIKGRENIVIIVEREPLQVIIHPEGNDQLPKYIIVSGIDISIFEGKREVYLVPIIIGPLYDYKKYILIRNIFRKGYILYYTFNTTREVAYYINIANNKGIYDHIIMMKLPRIDSILHNCISKIVYKPRTKIRIKCNGKLVEASMRFYYRSFDKQLDLDIKFSSKNKLRIHYLKIAIKDYSSVYKCDRLLHELYVFIKLYNNLNEELLRYIITEYYAHGKLLNIVKISKNGLCELTDKSKILNKYGVNTYLSLRQYICSKKDLFIRNIL